MKKFVIGMMVSSVLGAVPALAGGNQVAKMLQRATVGVKTVAKKPVAPQCANFSGKWVGQCSDGEFEPYRDELVVTQEGCAEIAFNGFSVPINGSTTVSTYGDPYGTETFSYQLSLAYTWNDSQVRLNSLLAGMVNHNVALMVTEQAWLDGDQLRIQGKKGAAMLMDGSGQGLSLRDCTYNRVE